MTTYNGTNMGLEQDASGNWVFTNPAQTFIDPATFSTPDPDFPTAQVDDEEEQDTTCGEGYIYDSTLKKCVPEVTGYEGQVAAYTDSERDYAKDAQENYVDFREMSYDEMVDFGKKAGFFNAAGTFIGAPDTKVPFPMIKGLSQFGLDSQANRFAINFAKKGGKIWNPNQGFIGNLYIPPPTTSGASVWADSMNKILDVKESVTTPVTTLTSAKDIGAYTGGVDYDDQSSPYDIQINEEKVKQEKEKTKQQQIKTDKEIDKDTGKFSGSPAATQGGSFSDKDTGKFSGSPSSGTSLGSSVHGTGSYNKPTSKSKRQTGPRMGDR